MNLATVKAVGVGRICSITVAAVLGLGTYASAAILYSDDFSGAQATNLHTLVPDVRNGTDGADASATWLAQQDTNFRANGLVESTPNNNGMAVLPFAPLADRVYTLTGTINTTFASTTTQDWLGIGFAGAYSGTQGQQSFAQAGNGYAWMLVRMDRGVGQGSTFGGALQTNSAVYDSPTGVVACQIVLDTRDDNWQVTWYANNAELRTFTYTAVGNPGINYVGFSKIGNAKGFVDNFELSAVVPEPAAMGLLAMALPLLGRRRR